MSHILEDGSLMIAVGERATPLNQNYTAITELAIKCRDNNIPCALLPLYDGLTLVLYRDGEPFADVIEHNGSYGHEGNLLESSGFPGDNGDVVGWLSVEEAWERIDRVFFPKIESKVVIC